MRPDVQCSRPEQTRLYSYFHHKYQIHSGLTLLLVIIVFDQCMHRYSSFTKQTITNHSISSCYYRYTYTKQASTGSNNRIVATDIIKISQQQKPVSTDTTTIYTKLIIVSGARSHADIQV
eukprot:392621_1